MHFIGGKGENINSREQGTGIREQGTGNREQRTENREQREEGPRRPIPIRTPEIPAAMDERDLENSLNTGPSTDHPQRRGPVAGDPDCAERVYARSVSLRMTIALEFVRY
jgi:hypothetical protein